MSNSSKNENLDEKIYVLCYIKPRWITELAEIFYGPDEISIRDNKSTISNKIDELINRNWLKVDKNYNSKVKSLMKLEKKPIDRRKISNRKYVTYKSLNPIREKININVKDKSSLTSILKNDDFKKLIKDDIRTYEDIIGTLTGLVELSHYITKETSKSLKLNSAIDKALASKKEFKHNRDFKSFDREKTHKTFRLAEFIKTNFSDKGKKEIIEACPYSNVITSVGLHSAVLVNSFKK